MSKHSLKVYLSIYYVTSKYWMYYEYLDTNYNKSQYCVDAVSVNDNSFDLYDNIVIIR